MRLELYSQDLSRPIFRHIGNLSFQRVLNLENNSFHSMVPLEVSQLSRLRTLYLNNNSLSGPIPPSLSSCSDLANIDLCYNMLEGLLSLDLGDNKLTGAITPEIMSLLSVSIIADFSENNLSEELPMETRSLKIRGALLLHGNKFSGEIPSSIGGSISLENL
ncbi:hypothetical protein CRG98_023522 [Punica granatum]|uniref:Uncharacterized protein n=1 Tax=Punica granatum TaxID=22663 RepID=A0A2I0JJJ6_PUNGR|nr:hypothetical protein CRG98_023522 [Punica granatum]